MPNQELFTKRTLAARWGTSAQTIDRLRQAGKLPWINIAGGRGARPIVRFTLADVQQFERAMRQSGQDAGGVDGNAA